MTCEEAAVLIEAEGRLGAGKYFGEDGCRCVIAVLEDMTTGYKRRRYIGWMPGIKLVQAQYANDAFEGTPEERCVYMATWFRRGGKA